MDYKSIFNKTDVKILITGDSLSYNRYDYDEKPRLSGDAFSYGAGLGSWSFKLRDRVYFADPQFKFGSEIEFNCKSILGLDNTCETPNTEVFGGKIKTLLPNVDVFKTSDLFDNDRVEDWRFDNVHLNRKGNDILLNALLEKFKIKKRV